MVCGCPSSTTQPFASSMPPPSNTCKTLTSAHQYTGCWVGGGESPALLDMLYICAYTHKMVNLQQSFAIEKHAQCTVMFRRISYCHHTFESLLPWSSTIVGLLLYFLSLPHRPAPVSSGDTNQQHGSSPQLSVDWDREWHRRFLPFLFANCCCWGGRMGGTKCADGHLSILSVCILGLYHLYFAAALCVLGSK